MNEELPMKDWLKDNLLKYLSHSENKSKELSDAIGINRKIIPRILAGADVTLENAIPLIKFFCTSDNLHSVLQKYIPELAESLKPRLENSNFNVAGQEINEYIKLDNIYYEVSCYAGFNGGTTISFIKEKYGSKGVNALRELVEEGILFENGDGKVKSKNPKTACTDIDTIVSKLSYHIKNFDRDALREHQIGSIAQHNGTASLKGLKALRILNIYTHELFTRLYEKPWFQGDIPYFYQSLCGTLNKDESNKVNTDEYKKLQININEIKG